MAAAFPKIVSPNSFPAFATVDGATAHNLRLVGLEVTVDPAVAAIVRILRLGHGETALVTMPRDIIVDRCYIHGQPTVNVQSGLLFEGIRMGVVDSYISECHYAGADAQAILVLGAGPYKIVNDYLEGSGENVMFGGANTVITDLVPSDIEFRLNHLFKPLAWNPNDPSYDGSHWTIKNLLEFKSGQRALIDSNVLENCWVSGQTGYCFLIKSVDPSLNPWAVSRDITLSNNIIRNVAIGASIAGFNTSLEKTTRVRVVNNLGIRS